MKSCCFKRESWAKRQTLSWFAMVLTYHVKNDQLHYNNETNVSIIHLLSGLLVFRKCIIIVSELGSITSRSLESACLPGGWARAHFPKQRLAIESISEPTLAFKKYLKIQIKLHWWLKDNICYKNVSDVSVAITDLLQGKWKKKSTQKHRYKQDADQKFKICVTFSYLRESSANTPWGVTPRHLGWADL